MLTRKLLHPVTLSESEAEVVALELHPSATDATEESLLLNRVPQLPQSPSAGTLDGKALRNHRRDALLVGGSAVCRDEVLDPLAEVIEAQLRAVAPLTLSSAITHW